MNPRRLFDLAHEAARAVRRDEVNPGVFVVEVDVEERKEIRADHAILIDFRTRLCS